MNLSQKGIDLVKHFEGLYLTAYLCPAKVWTIGYGHTGIKHNDGTVKRGQKITKGEAEKLLAFDLQTKYAPDVRRMVKVPVNQSQFDALVSFHFNTGALGRSTLLRLLNAGDVKGAGAQFARWTRGGGRVLPGLVRRRKAERHLFETGELKFFQ
jgi:lysozyme